MGKLLFFFPVGIPTADAGAIPRMKQDDESSASVGCADCLRRAAVGKVSDDGAAKHCGSPLNRLRDSSHGNGLNGGGYSICAYDFYA